MVEIWVPYGKVEVSFDIKQENLSQIIEAQPNKILQEDFEKRIDSITCEALLILSESPGSQKVIDTLLRRNKSVAKLIYPKGHGALVRRKAQEFGVQSEPFNVERLVESDVVDGSPARIFQQIKEDHRLAILSTSHYDPMFGLTCGASDLFSYSIDLKAQAFNRSLEELPCSLSKSSASKFAIRLLQTCPDIDLIQVIENKGSGLVEFYYGDPESVHAQSIDYWKKSFAVNLQSRAERIIFGSGGSENDRNLTDALSRAFFQIASGAAMGGEFETKLCMLAECSQGLGRDAFFKFVSGKLVPGLSLERQSYFDGLEVLTSFFRMSKTFDMSILSTLPRYYLGKFDMKFVKGSRDAPSALVSPGSRAKILVVPDASTCYFTS